MSKVYSGSAVPRHLVFVLEDGSFVVQWGHAQVQDMLTGRYRPFDYNEFGHTITDYELSQLKLAGTIEHFNRNYVWLFAMPEPKRFGNLRTQERTKSRIRTFYLNTTLPRSQLDALRNLLLFINLADRFEPVEREGLVAILAKNGAPFPDLKDAENAQRQLIAKAPDIFNDSAVAFIESNEMPGEESRAEEGNSDTLDLATLIASQTDTSMTADKRAVVVCGVDDQRQAIYKLLVEMKMRVQAAANGAEGLRAVEDVRPDILVMDLQFPDMHGWQMLGKVREIEGLPEMLTLLIAEHGATPGDQSFALGVARVDIFLVKPVSMARLRQNIWMALKRRVTA
jgi:CheY-like chemotaxis protein